MIIRKGLILTLLMVGVFATTGYAQSADMIQKAKMAGMSDAQIQDMMRQQQQTSGGSTSTGKAKSGTDVSKLPDQSLDRAREERPYDLKTKSNKVSPNTNKTSTNKITSKANSLTDATNTTNSKLGQTTLRQDSLFNQATEDLDVEDMVNEYNELKLEEARQRKLDREKEKLRGKVFGREVFSGEDLTYSPNYNMATPKGYQLAAGDEVAITVWGASALNIVGVISPDGNITIPDLGPVHLAGLTIEAAEKRLRADLSQIYVGLSSENPNTFVTLSLANIRSIKVNVVGEAVRPGTYTLPSLASLFNALYVAGGVNDIGSLRSVKVYRNSKLVADLDVYDYLLNGKYDSNIRLEDNDMVIISPYDNLAKITGKIKRERIFELAKGETLADLIRYSGGFTGDAYTDNIEIQRKSGRMYQVYTVDNEDYGVFKIIDGDSINVGKVVDLFENRAVVRGALMRPGTYGISENLRTVADLIRKAEGLRGDAFLQRAVLTRLREDFTPEVIALDVKAILNGSVSDIELKRDDNLYIPSIYDIQEDFTLSIDGAVNKPMIYDYKKGMTIEDLIIEAGGLKQSASKSKIEVARRIRNPYSNTYSDQTAENYSFSVAENLEITPEGAGFVLEPFDEVYVRVSPGYQQQRNVIVEGEILFGGNYTLAVRGERLSDVVKRAGGVTPSAYVRGARLSRQLNDEERLRAEDKLKLAKQGGRDSLDMNMLDLGTTYYVGIDLEAALANPGSDADIVLREGDKIMVPEYNNTVKISGSVMYPNTVVYNPKMRVSDYISQGGGFSQRAKKSKVFIVYMNGRVATVTSNSPKLIQAGCEIIVPVKPPKNGQGLATTMGLLNSTVSMAAMLTSILK